MALLEKLRPHEWYLTTANLLGFKYNVKLFEPQAFVSSDHQNFIDW